MAGYGKTQENLQQNSVSSAVISSQIGSLKGNTTVAAGGKLTTEAAQLYAGGDLHLQGREVSLGEAYKRNERHSEAQHKQSGFSVGITYDPYTAGKNARISAQKARLVADLIRGKDVAQALNILAFSPKKGAELIKKVLESAIANAEHNNGADIDELKVVTIFVDKGPSLKRFQARAKGRGNRIEKQTCHINVTVGN